jgi:uncharacterized membrane protein YidH (DUF202 family)
MRALRRLLRRIGSDPFSRSIALSLALIAGGFAAFGVAWRGAARSVIVAEQVAFLVSGGLGGVALILAGSGILAVQSSRYWNARERLRLEELVTVAGKLATQADGASVISRVSAPPK